MIVFDEQIDSRPCRTIEGSPLLIVDLNEGIPAGRILLVDFDQTAFRRHDEK